MIQILSEICLYCYLSKKLELVKAVWFGIENGCMIFTVNSPTVRITIELILSPKDSHGKSLMATKAKSQWTIHQPPIWNQSFRSLHMAVIRHPYLAGQGSCAVVLDLCCVPLNLYDFFPCMGLYGYSYNLQRSVFYNSLICLLLLPWCFYLAGREHS